ncbi:unnamed protein product [Chrysoparadoxa australica]
MLRNENGVTFVQPLVSLFLLGGVFVVGFKLFQNQTKLGTSSSFQFESITLLDEVKSLLNDRQSCTASFKGMSAIYEEVSEIKRYNPVVQRADLEFGVYTGNGPVYGQGNVLINRMVLLGEDLGFNFDKGLIVLKIDFQKNNERSTEFKGMIPIRVDVDSIGKILSCQTSPGLHQERASESDSTYWREANYNPEKMKAIENSDGNVLVGDVEAKAKLNVEGGITLNTAEFPSECFDRNRGLLMYNSTEHALYFCGPGKKPVKIHDNGDFFETQKLIKIRNNEISLKRETTKIRYKLCRLSDMKGIRGKCLANPLNPKDGKFFWELLIQYDSGPEVTCEFLCGN